MNVEKCNGIVNVKFIKYDFKRVKDTIKYDKLGRLHYRANEKGMDGRGLRGPKLNDEVMDNL